MPMTETSRRVAVVTGSSRGIGLAIATRLAQDGYDVAACSRSCPEALSALIARHPGVRFFPIDLADTDAVKACAQALQKAYTRIDALVNAAGIAAGGLFAMTRIEDIKRVFDVNYFHQILFTQYVAKKMVRAKAGAIVNIASVAGLRADAGTLSYGGSKAALVHATAVMATELGPFGIRVNAVAPAVVETAMAAEMDEAAKAALNQRSALQGTVEATDVANLVSFLVSDAAAKMTGQVLRLDRGLN
jgi:3-oxoacyl-[acyl-carrier protein] reductase